MAVLKAKPVEQALRKYGGNMAAVGRKFGVTREAVRQFVAGRPTLQEVCRECRESMTDAAESSLYKAVRKGEAWAVCFYLKCQGKARGYVEKPDDQPKDDGKSAGVPVELVTRLFALLGSRQPDAAGVGNAPAGGALDSQPGGAEPGVPQ